jgi:TPR repeat protein
MRTSRIICAFALLATCAAAQATDGDRPLSPDLQINPERFTKKLDPAYGAYQRGLYRTAYNLALKDAQAGDPASQTLVAEILSRGLGIKKDEKAAAEWYQRAAEQGVPDAQFQYALLLLDGRLVKKDVRAAHALMQAAAEAGNTLAQFNFAQMLVEEDPGPSGVEKAETYYRRAADAGLADAQYAMAQIASQGTTTEPGDDAEARKWLEKAALQNFDTAELDLGTWLIEGRGGPKDETRGFRILKHAAEGGNVAAQNRVAKLYVGGIGTTPDSIFAAAWYILARRAGLTDPGMEDFMNGLTEDEIKTALLRANRLR